MFSQLSDVDHSGGPYLPPEPENDNWRCEDCLREFWQEQGFEKMECPFCGSIYLEEI